MARSLGALYLAGATIGQLSLFLPRAPGTNVGALQLNIALAYLGGLTVLFVFRRLPVWTFHIAMLAGTALITRAIYYSGDAVSYYGVWYVWVALFAFSFFRRGEAVIHIVIAGAAYAAVLAVRSDPVAQARWLTTIASLLIAGVFIDALVSRIQRQRRQAVDRRAQPDCRRGCDGSCLSTAGRQRDARRSLCDGGCGRRGGRRRSVGAGRLRAGADAGCGLRDEPRPRRGARSTARRAEPGTPTSTIGRASARAARSAPPSSTVTESAQRLRSVAADRARRSHGRAARSVLDASDSGARAEHAGDDRAAGGAGGRRDRACRVCWRAWNEPRTPTSSRGFRIGAPGSSGFRSKWLARDARAGPSASRCSTSTA